MGLRKQISAALLLLNLGVILFCSLGISVQAQEEENKNNVPVSGAISGQVVNELGQPIPLATIFVTAQKAPQPRTTVTDEGGNFQLSGLDPSLYLVTASAPSYIVAPRGPDTLLPYHRIGERVTLSLQKGGVITGTVTSSTGEPLVQVGVRALLIRDANGKPPMSRGFPIDRRTDDRGIYRIYGMSAGTYLVSAGGRGINTFFSGAYESDAPTFAPSSTRETAAEIVVRAGEETNGVDIRYRGEPGHSISGIVSGPIAPNMSGNIFLTQNVEGFPHIIAFSYQMPNSKGFAFYGIADGDYDLVAQSSLGQGEGAASETRHISVKGADLSGVELVVKGFASISGHVALDTSTAPECKNKRQPLYSETMLVARRSAKNQPKDTLALQGSAIAQGSPDKAGDFLLRNLVAGQFTLDTRFFAKYWYLRSMVRGPAGPPSPGTTQGGRQSDAARNGIQLKSGERVSDVIVTLAEGAASVRGSVRPAKGENVSAKLYFNLVPAEKENIEDLLRFFIVPVNSDGTFVLGNLPPGRYWALLNVVGDGEPQSDSGLRAPEGSDQRKQILRAAEAAKTTVELKPCQNVSNYELPLKNRSLENQPNQD